MKWYGNIGFAMTSETSPGIWEESIVDKPYYGDVLKLSRKSEQQSGSTINNIRLVNQISIISDAFANNNLYSIKYVEFMGNKWSVSSVTVNDPPRLLLELGGVYNG